MNILVTGGAGYIGSHTVVALITAGHTVTIIDNFSNSSPKVLDKLERLCGVRPDIHAFDLADKTILQKLFDEVPFDAVIHFAGLKAVGESVDNPLQYYRINIDS